MNSNCEFLFTYDIESWLNSSSEDSFIEDFKFEKPQRICFELTKEQFDFVEEKIKIFGNSINGLSQALKRIPNKTLWRLPIKKSNNYSE